VSGIPDASGVGTCWAGGLYLVTSKVECVTDLGESRFGIAAGEERVTAAR